MPPPNGPAAQAAHSRFVQRIRRRYEAELSLLPPGAPDKAGITALVAQLGQGGRDLASALRVARQLVLERLVVLDVEQAAPLDTITHTMTYLAEATLELALAQAQAEAKALALRIAEITREGAEKMDAENAALIARLRVSEEGQEGLSAFLDKRPPRWISET